MRPAVQHAVAPIAEAATRLEASVEAGKDINELMELTVRLMELCRSTFDAYLPAPTPLLEDEANKAEPPLGDRVPAARRG